MIAASLSIAIVLEKWYLEKSVSSTKDLNASACLIISVSYSLNRVVGLLRENSHLLKETIQPVLWCFEFFWKYTKLWCISSVKCLNISPANNLPAQKIVISSLIHTCMSLHFPCPLVHRVHRNLLIISEPLRNSNYFLCRKQDSCPLIPPWFLSCT